MSASYSGMLKAAMTKPAFTKAINTMKDVFESGLPVEIMDCLEMEGHISQDSDAMVKQVYDNRIVTPFSSWLKGCFL